MASARVARLGRARLAREWAYSPRCREFLPSYRPNRAIIDRDGDSFSCGAGLRVRGARRRGLRLRARARRTPRPGCEIRRARVAGNPIARRRGHAQGVGGAASPDRGRRRGDPARSRAAQRGLDRDDRQGAGHREPASGRDRAAGRTECRRRRVERLAGQSPRGDFGRARGHCSAWAATRRRPFWFGRATWSKRCGRR